MTPRTDIIISLHATREYPCESLFVKCIETLKATTQNYRLVLVDDACDEIAEKVISDVAKEHQTVLVKTNKQRWFTRSYNAGLRMARTPWVVLLNCDVELGSGWLEELYAVREEVGDRCGLVGSVMSMEEPRRFSETVKPGFVTGHCWLASMQALYEISNKRGQPGIYLDETTQRCIHIFSDNEACYSMNELGWRTIQSFKSQVGHHGGKSWGHNLGRVLSLKLADVDW